MPVAPELLLFRRSGAAAADQSILDPNAALGGFRALNLVNIQSTLTAAMTALGTIVDSTRVDDTPAGPVDLRTPLEDSGNYAQAAQLVHWYRFGYDTLDLGADFGVGTPIRFDTIRGALAVSDIDLGVQPGQFDQQRHSLHFNSAGAADNDALVSPSGGSTWGFGNAFSVGTWARTTSIAAGTSTLFRFATGAGTGNSLNGIRIERQTANLVAVICDQSVATTRKEYVYNNFFAANTWYHIMLTWDGTSMLLYKDGVLVAPDTLTVDNAVTRVDSGSVRLIVGGGNNSTADPGTEWFGQIHSMGLWSVPLGAAAISALSDFGDGEGPEPLDHAGDYLVFITGVNAMEARKVLFHNVATGEMHLERPLPSLGSSGDIYRLGRAMELFNDGPTPLECAEGLVDHRLIVLRNTTGEQLTNVRFWLKPLNPRTIDIQIAAGDTDIGATGIPSIAVDTDVPDIKTTGSAFFSNAVQAFRRPLDFASATETPHRPTASDLIMGNNVDIPIWIQRTTLPLTRQGKSAWLLVVEAASGSISGAGPWRSACVIASEPAGFTPDFTLTFDRTPRTFGGAHLIARLRDASTGVPVEDIDIEFELLVGPGTIESVTDPVVTDENGIARAEYIAPEDDSQAGATVTIEARFGGE